MTSNWKVGEGTVRMLLKETEAYIKEATDFNGKYVGEHRYLIVHSKLKHYLQEQGFEETPGNIYGN